MRNKPTKHALRFASAALLLLGAGAKAIEPSQLAEKYQPLAGSVELTDHFNKEAAAKLISQGINEIVFVKRNTFDADHFYTEYVNSSWKPGGNLSILDLHSGDVSDLVPQFTGGVFNRFDISFDAKKIVFDYKKSNETGYRIYEINVDGTGLKQLTFPQKDEAELVSKYGSKKYHHGTDDLHPCYLPDGGIAFVSTRVQHGILCNAPDYMTAKVLYRMNADGSGMRALSNNSVSEASPSIMPDGRILYHRWEYNDKAAGNAKCLWAIRPDGSGSVEVYGNTLTQPETLIYPRSIPGAPNKILCLATSHCCPNNAMGTVITIDTSKNIRTREPITYITKDIDARAHNGFHFNVNGKWIHEKTGQPGRLFKDPYPITEKLFIASYKPKGYRWDHPNAYDLCLLNDKGETTSLFQQKNISCWHAYPLVPRHKPAPSDAPVNAKLAKENKAECIVTDVYVGMPQVKRGTIKYLRIMEHVPRPWAARNKWTGDRNGMAHTAVGTGRLGLKVQHGVVPVEPDGSAYFTVPAGRNIYFQALDENYMSVQTERTFINYAPGETRSCIGCHETPGVTPANVNKGVAMALKRKASDPQPQPGDSAAAKTISFMAQVQPILDKHCISCHSGDKPEANLNLSDAETTTFTKSYDSLMAYNTRLGTPITGEYNSANENRGSADISYRNPYASGSHTSPLVTIISNGRITLKHPKAKEITERLVKAHKDIKVSRNEFINVVNWLDSFSQFYPSYWGLKNIGYKGHEFFRPEVSVEEALSKTVPPRFKELYEKGAPGYKPIIPPRKKRKKKKK